MLPFHFVDSSLRQELKGKSGSLIGNRITFADGTFQWNDLERFGIVVLGIGDDSSFLNSIRKYFYKLHFYSDKPSLIDLGDVSEDPIVISACLINLLKSNVLTLLLNPSSATLSNVYSQAVKISKDISVTSIAADTPVEELSAFFAAKDPKLSRYSALAYQSYFADPQYLKQLSKQNCELMRLGIIRNKIMETEPILRDTHLLNINMNAVRVSDGGAGQLASPNGLYAEELCQLAWYAGKGESLELCTINGVDTANFSETTVHLIAQTLWHLVDGYSARRNELPTGDNIKRFIVDRGREGEELVFFQSSITGRWWMAIPVLGEIDNYVAVACTYDDYLKASALEVPDRWLFYYQKLNGI
ncbi:MAG: hypothetical protein LBG19_05875 [Prevotellaceae bacterium]|jgi:hypothetical protein|nr:hypothetical protein [Prevotellaceae bacterium]